MGTECEDGFVAFFGDLHFSLTKLGRTEKAKNELMAKVHQHPNWIDFELENIASNVLGDVYEYLIGKFARGPGKKVMEFYTPASGFDCSCKARHYRQDKTKICLSPDLGYGWRLSQAAR